MAYDRSAAAVAANDALLYLPLGFHVLLFLMAYHFFKDDFLAF